MQEDCIFCKISSGASPAQIEYENGRWVVFHDINPSAPIHLLIVPKEHIQWNTLFDDTKELLGEIFLIAPEVAESLGVKNSGYKLVMNCGRGVGQIVDHFHIHLLAGWQTEAEAHNIS